MPKQIYAPRRTQSTIHIVDDADWLVTAREWDYIESAITATEKAMDNALWDGQYDLANKYKRELDGLRIALGVGEKYVTNF